MLHRTNTLVAQRVNGLRVNAARLRADIELLASIGRTSEGALARYAFSPAYEEARAWLKTRMAHAGMAVRDDAAGNTSSYNFV